MLSALHGALGTRLGSAGSIEFFEGKHPADAKSLPSCNAMYSTKVFKLSGGFDESCVLLKTGRIVRVRKQRVKHQMQ